MRFPNGNRLTSAVLYRSQPMFIIIDFEALILASPLRDYLADLSPTGFLNVFRLPQ